MKGGVAISGDRVYVGDYSGHRLRAERDDREDPSGRRRRSRASAAPATFYATPAVAYGRVYIGATDGKVYSFGATSGKLRWSQSTGGYVYSSPAVWRDRVYVGSYSQQLLLLRRGDRDILWQFKANGPISGSPTVIAGRVYFATLKGTTYALDAQDRRRSSGRIPDGKYSPVVADAERLYLVGLRADLRARRAARCAAATQRLVSASAHCGARSVRRGRSGRRPRQRIGGRSPAASKASGVQVCNVVAAQAKGLVAGERSGAPCSAVQKACRG